MEQIATSNVAAGETARSALPTGADTHPWFESPTVLPPYGFLAVRNGEPEAIAHVKSSKPLTLKEVSGLLRLAYRLPLSRNYGWIHDRI
jgi:hypothetical protein